MPVSTLILILVVFSQEAKALGGDNSSLILFGNLTRSVNESRLKCAESYCLPIEYALFYFIIRIPLSRGALNKMKSLEPSILMFVCLSDRIKSFATTGPIGF